MTINFPGDAGKKFEMFQYPGGETQVRFTELQITELGSADEVLVFALIQNAESLIGLAMLASALDGMGMLSTLFIPYLPYARADRRFTNVDCYGLGVFAGIVNQMHFDRVITLDAHSKVASEDIENLIDVSPKPIIDMILELPEMAGAKILLPDAGAERYGYSYHAALQCSKKRDPETGKFVGFFVPDISHFGGAKSILVIDDICDGGGTFVGIAEALKAAGVEAELNLYVSHGIFSKGLLELRKYYKRIYTTDSLPQSKRATYDYGLTVIPAGGTMLQSILSPAELWQNAERSKL